MVNGANRPSARPAHDIERTQWLAPHRRTVRGRKSRSGSHAACVRTTAGGFGFDPLPQRLRHGEMYLGETS